MTLAVEFTAVSKKKQGDFRLILMIPLFSHYSLGKYSQF